jgi:hypothetical protein
MTKNYETLELKIILLNSRDLITESPATDGGEDDLVWTTDK